jgi:hypothetical protein
MIFMLNFMNDLEFYPKMLALQARKGYEFRAMDGRMIQGLF